MKFYKNYYSILSLYENATSNEIKKAYYSKALNYHPDKLNNGKGEDEFLDISEAYYVLKDPKIRAEYDQKKTDPSIFMFEQVISRKILPHDLQEIVKYGANLDERNEMGQNILMVAANRCNLNIVRYLLEQNISANAVDNEGTNVLMFASMVKPYLFFPPKSKLAEPPHKGNTNNSNNEDYSKESQKSSNENPVKQNKEKERNSEVKKIEAAPHSFQEQKNQEKQQKQNFEYNKENFIFNPPEQFSSQDRTEIAEILVKYGANPVNTNKYNSNAIGYAVFFKLKELEVIFLNSINNKHMPGEVSDHIDIHSL